MNVYNDNRRWNVYNVCAAEFHYFNGPPEDITTIRFYRNYPGSCHETCEGFDKYESGKDTYCNCTVTGHTLVKDEDTGRYSRPEDCYELIKSNRSSAQDQPKGPTWIKWLKDYPDLCDPGCEKIRFSQDDAEITCTEFSYKETPNALVEDWDQWVQFRAPSCKRLTRHLVD